MNNPPAKVQKSTKVIGQIPFTYLMPSQAAKLELIDGLATFATFASELYYSSHDYFATLQRRFANEIAFPF